jgi:outer membrane lipoprotein carrier protein
VKPFFVALLLPVLSFVLYGLISVSGAFASDLNAVVAGLQGRYASVETIAGDFKQTYRAPGIDQVESGVFQMKRPGFMRWEYRQPEEKLFVADGREAFLYVPRDHQVTIQSFKASDIHGTPLEFLLGATDIKKSFSVSSESVFKPIVAQTVLLRLTPRSGGGEYEFLVVEIDQNTFDLRRIIIREHGGNTSEFLLTNIVVNVKIETKAFQFKPPKGVEVVRLKNEQ